MNCNINDVTIAKLYEKMKQEGIVNSIAIETYINKILEENVKNIKLEPKVKPFKRTF